jgi:hypothetical protein
VPSHSSTIEPFLTDYDPSDLPSTSVDPLGFESGYLVLVDKILPGLTSVSSHARYFAMLCAGASLADTSGANPREQVELRKQTVMRFERLWALACCLADDKDDDSRSALGVRGVSYAAKHADAIRAAGADRTGCGFTMLSRQSAYGVLGMYGWVADALRLIDRPTLEPTPDLGDRLAAAFLDETGAPAAIRNAAIDDRREVPVSALAKWGATANLSAPVGPEEGSCLGQALHHNEVRSRMARRLAATPYFEDERGELGRLKRVARALEAERGGADRDLLEALRAILAYEESYALVQLALERLLWLTRIHPTGAPALTDLRTDRVFTRVGERLGAAVQAFSAALDGGETPAFRLDLHRLRAERDFLERAAAVATDSIALAREVVQRHKDVQAGKWDGGKAKGPWLELDTKGHFMRAPTRVGGLSTEATVPEQIAPHPYRLAAVDSLIAAAKAAP